MTAKAVLFCSTSLLCFSPEAIGQSGIFINPNVGDISGSAYGEVFTVARFRAGVLGDQNAVVKFRVERVDMVANAPNFLVVSPSEGSTEIRIGPNPNVIRNMLPTRPPGTYGGIVTFTTVDQSPPTTFRALVRLTLRGPPSPSVGSVANPASFKPAITPGGMVSIFGENLGPPVFAAEYNGDGRYPTTLGNTTVTFMASRLPCCM